MRIPMLVAALFVGAYAGAPGDSPVADAAMRGDTALVHSLIRKHADVNAPQGDGMTALHWAATHGDASEARLLVSAGAHVDVVTRNGAYTPLILASKNGRAATIRVLIKAGANVNARTTSGGATPLHFAAANGDPDAVTALLDSHAAVDARDSALSQTPLMWAADANRVQAIQVLVAHGADLKATSKVENVAQKEAADRAATQKKRAANPDLPAYLLAAGGRGGRGGAAGGGRGAGRGGTPTDSTKKPDSTAAKRDTGSVVTADGLPVFGFGGAGAGGGGGRIGNSNDLYGNKGGLTPLLFAAREGHMEAAAALLKAGADVNQISAGDHSSPLLLATINGQFDLAKMLLEHGANPKLASDAGATPLYATINVQWAAKSLYPQPTAQLQQQTTYLDLMEQLLKAGADPNARLTKHLWYMSYNFDLLGVNTTGATPFWRAAYGTDVPAMRLLVKYGADPKLAYTIKTAGRLAGADAPVETDATGGKDPSGLPPVPDGAPAVLAIHAASGVGYGEGYAANSHMHAPDGWLPSVKYLIEELGFDVNARDFNGYTAMHHAAARGDNELILYLVSKGGDVKVVSRKGQTTVDMANGPVQRVSPFPETIALLEKLGAVNSHKCKSC